MSDIIASPSVRAMARARGIDLEQRAKQLGRTHITQDDLNATTSSPAAYSSNHMKYWDVDHAKYGAVSSEPTSRFSQMAAATLTAANAIIPQVTHHDQADVSKLETFRKSLKSEAQAHGIKVTALAFHVMALARTLEAFPIFNTSLSPDGKTLVRKEFIHIGIAVDTPHGLMVPVIRNADQKGIFQLSQDISDFAKRAQDRKIIPDEMGGASMTISNLGGIGGTAFTPIVNPPEVAILGITKTRIEPAWNGEAFDPVPMTPLDLSYDHRVINGADAARFMATLCKLLSDPRHMVTIGNLNVR